MLLFHATMPLITPLPLRVAIDIRRYFAGLIFSARLRHAPNDAYARCAIISICGARRVFMLCAFAALPRLRACFIDMSDVVYTACAS